MAALVTNHPVPRTPPTTGEFLQNALFNHIAKMSGGGDN